MFGFPVALKLSVMSGVAPVWSFKVPAFTVVAADEALEPDSVSTPFEFFVTATPDPIAPENAPESTVATLVPPAPFAKMPAPFSEPRLWLVPFKSSVAPPPTEVPPV